MAQINDDYLRLPGSYLFADIAHKVNAYREKRPDVELIRLGIGDVTRPLPPSVIKALHKAVDEQATAEGFRGYGPEQGYDFLRSLIAEHDYRTRGVELELSLPARSHRRGRLRPARRGDRSRRHFRQ